jgi:seryl-tRNA synthetase
MKAATREASAEGRGRRPRWRAERRDAGARARDALLAEALPNILDADVPDGVDESANVVLHVHGEPATFGFAPKQHFELGEALGLMDFATAAKLAGAASRC